MGTQNKSLTVAKGYLVGLVLTFAIGLLTIAEVVEIEMFCICGDVCCLLWAGGVLVVIALLAIIAIRFIIRNKHIKI